MALVGAAVGFSAGIFLMGVISLVKGKAELSKTPAAYGRPAQLSAVICMTPLPVISLIALVTRPQDVALFPYFINLLISPTGLAISTVGFVIALGVIYSSSEETKAKNEDVR